MTWRPIRDSFGFVRLSERAAAGIIAAVVLLLFGTPLRGLWAQLEAPWWTPFALWALIIAAIAVNARRGAS
jgi:hypothetical protein